MVNFVFPSKTPFKTPIGNVNVKIYVVIALIMIHCIMGIYIRWSDKQFVKQKEKQNVFNNLNKIHHIFDLTSFLIY